MLIRLTRRAMRDRLVLAPETLNDRSWTPFERRW